MAYQVTITNGTGSLAMQKGEYAVTCTQAQGYNLTSLSPTTYTVTTAPGSQAFTLTADGTLTLTVNETGAQGGTPITSGSIVMTDQTGATEYGSAVTIDQTGVATFNNVPYGDGTNPITLYFKQTATDADHNLYESVITVTMDAQTVTSYVKNDPIALQSFTLTDATYSGLPVGDAILEFDKSTD